MAEIKETAITIDHETGRVRIDTTSNRVKHRLKSLGLKEITKQRLGPYSSWVGDEKNVRFAKIRSGTGRKPSAAFLASKRTYIESKKVERGDR